jgi:cytochrome c oxidase subunit 4
MATAAHKHPNYMAIFWWLAILTVVELAVVFAPMSKVTIGVLLCALALTKAALVAAYFMHLKFEAKTLTWVACTPLAIAILLSFILMPDGFAVAKKTAAGTAPIAAPAAKH